MNEKYYRLWRLFMEKLAAKTAEASDYESHSEKDVLLQVLIDMARLEGEVALEE